MFYDLNDLTIDLEYPLQFVDLVLMHVIARHNVDHHTVVKLLLLSHILHIQHRHQQLELPIHELVLKPIIVVLLN